MYITKLFPVFIACYVTIVEPQIFEAFKQAAGNLLFCRDYFLASSINASISTLKFKIFGQPFVQKVLIPILERHFEINETSNVRPSTPLVLRFNGPSGVGKSFVADHLLKSDYFWSKNFFSVSSYFNSDDPLSARMLKEEIIDKLNRSSKFCSRSIFVFDGVDTAPPGFFEEFPPFVPWPKNLRESLFIYISQSDSPAIEWAIAELQNEGKSREDIQIGSFLDTLKLYNSSRLGAIIKDLSKMFLLIEDKSLPSSIYEELYIPFLPLDSGHVERCIDRESRGEYYRVSRSKVIKRTLSMIECPNEKGFCPTGCKQVHSKLPIAMNSRDEL